MRVAVHDRCSCDSALVEVCSPAIHVNRFIGFLDDHRHWHPDLQPRPASQFPEWRWRYAPGVTHNTEHVFGLRMPAPSPVRIAPREHVGYVWLTWEAAAQRCFSWSNAAAIRSLPSRAE